MEQELLQEIREFLKSSGMGPSYFGKLACGNSEIIARLESGGTVTVRSLVRIRTFISEYQSKNPDRTILPCTTRRATGERSQV
jgi:hypothetical protein